MKTLQGKTAVITGGASGIGRELAVALAREGCNLAIADVDLSGLDGTAQLARGERDVRITTHQLDVSKREKVYRFAEEAIEAHGGIDIVVNNAGVSLVESVVNMTYEDFNWLMDINFWGVVYGSKAFLPHLVTRPEASLVNVSSVFGIMATPYNGAYCAAKFAVRGFTETLYEETLDTPLRVTVVHPGGIKTNILRNARLRKKIFGDVSQEKAAGKFDRMAMTTAAEAARLIVEGIMRGKQRVLIGKDARMFDLAMRLRPGGTLRKVAERMARGGKKKKG